ncbi:MATE family efflux transporter [Lederbergia panacisoli]|uniref:MATE family efflux transporter n=1 Tax=Lederbergia panacisoli TaxID=1255251 RepID=UPI00214C2F13|nr:MATE family efflux transporter [Lederbergia panacisoli]MCR2820660.1 MATE family efflux transporter [Lederbergia panacisoli]
MKNWKKILTLAIPSIASFASMTLTGMINLIMIGNLGALAIAIVGVSNVIMYNAWAMFSGIGSTVNYLVAQNYGSNTMKKGLDRTFLALIFGSVAGIFTMLVGFFGAEGILRVMGSPENMVKEGTLYLQIRFYAMLFSILTFTLFSFFRGIGDTKTPMYASIIGNGVMIFFTYSLTYGNLGFPELGLKGAGIALFLGELSAFLLITYAFFKNLKEKFFIRFKPVFDFLEMKLIFNESFKLGTQEFSKSMAMLVYTAFVTRLGTNALAANEISLSVMNLGFMPAAAFGSTATILVGQEIGRNKPHLAKKLGIETAKIGAIFILILGTAEFFFAESISKIYTDVPEVFALSANLIMISAFLQLFDATAGFFAGGLRGIGDTTFLLRASLIHAWGIFVPLSYLLVFVFDFGSYGAWIALYGYLTVFGTTMAIRYLRKDFSKVSVKKSLKKTA